MVRKATTARPAHRARAVRAGLAVALLMAAVPGASAVAQDARSIELRAPSPEQRRQFLMEEHGYTNTPSPEQRRQFLMEEHGYTDTPSPEQRRQFLMEEHGYD